MCIEVEHFLIFYLRFLLGEFSLSFLCWLTVGVFMFSLSVSQTCWIIFLSLLVIITFLVFSCKNFNWHLIAYKNDFQNVNNNYHRGRHPSRWAPLCLCPSGNSLSSVRTETHLPPKRGSEAESSLNLYFIWEVFWYMGWDNYLNILCSKLLADCPNLFYWEPLAFPEIDLGCILCHTLEYDVW